ncbi:hypothetical protein [Maribacter aquivivus]|uniref:DUF1330 domain-containing protein n=1 Tax=Maribacter aquivivus TaxID=228958 RepID=A0A1M6SAT0_9FLAO|nr:hypothetical protein [Maribacter aquivivus]SHK41627.1 hypothetical protein SAMN04488007_3017 [Maribacter aquivivus]
MGSNTKETDRQFILKHLEAKSHTEINTEQLRAFSLLPMDKPVVMLNLLKFKETVIETGLTGAESYKNYMKAAMPYFQKANAEILYMGKPQRTLIGPENETLWDKILLIKYNTVADFLGMVKAEGYPSHLRDQALLDSRLIQCD